MNETDTPKKPQLRMDVRVAADFPLIIHCVESENTPLRDKPVPVQAVDISGGGLSFISEHELFVNDIVLVTVSSPRLRIEGRRAKVVSRSMHLGAPRTLCRCRFIAIDLAVKERIVKYVFERMREVIRT